MKKGISEALKPPKTDYIEGIGANCQVTIILSGDDNYLSSVKRFPQMGSRIAGNAN